MSRGRRLIEPSLGGQVWSVFLYNSGCSLDRTSAKLLTFEDDPTLFSRTQGASPPPKAPGLNINPLKPVETLTNFHKLTLEISTF
ncbi:hypothetical protein MHYP_G00087080 [Metynnis hypsauchen]